MEKRGLSQVVTTVVVILIVLGSVVLVWSFVRPVIFDSGERIGTEQFTADLEILSVVDDSLHNELSVRVKRNAGVGDVMGVGFIISDVDGNSKVFRVDEGIVELESKDFNIDYSGENLGELSEVAIAPIFSRDVIGNVADVFVLDGGEGVALPECSDGVDNDGDGKIDWGYFVENDDGCHSGFDNTESADVLTQIHWSEFPEFSLHDGFELYYYGIRIFDEDYALAPLDHGFTHVYMVSTTPSGRDAQDVSTRFTVWTGISLPCASQGMCPPDYAEQPWEEIESPWGNDLDVYHEFWGKRISFFASLYSDSVNSSFPNVDMISPDIEQKIDNWNNPLDDERIVSVLKGDPLVPSEINNLSDAEFIDRYKRDMAALYYEPATFLRDLGFAGKISAYADVPIERAWHGIDDFTWEQWTSDWEMVNYAVLNFSNNGSGFYQEFGPYYYEQEFVSPSAYYFYDYPPIGSDLDKSNDTNRWNSAARYLAYHLFQAEVNENWIQISGEEKPILLWQWLNYHPGSDGMDVPIRPHMAHASAIFPYFSGASGVHLWKTPAAYINSPKHISKYHDYVHGLYRLSEYNDFFDGDYEVYIPERAYSLFVNRMPVWRGIVKEDGSQILIAAHNPYAETDEETEFVFDYHGDILGTVSVKGLNTYLGVFDI